MEKPRFFLRKPIFLSKPAQIFRTFWEVLLLFSYSTANLLPLHFLMKSWFFFKSPFFLKKTRILNVLNHLIILLSFCTHLLTLSHFWNFNFFRWKVSSIFWNHPNYECLRNPYYFSRFYKKYASLSFFWLFKIILSKNRCVFSKKSNYLTLNVLGNLITSVAFYSKLATFCLSKGQFFSRNPSNFPKNPNFERFQKSYYMSRILRQVSYMLI